MSIRYICSECGKKYNINTLDFKCKCGGLFDLEYDLDFSPNDIIKNKWSLFRYKKGLPIDDWNWKDISMGEGMTPIVPFDSKNPNILVKLEYLMPTSSFKDRGAVMLIALAKHLGVKRVVQDSSGNAGTSVAAYAARANIECDIYVPEATSPRKIKQILAHGAKVHKISSSREDTAKAAINAAKKQGVFYASHVYNPFFYQGTKTYVYEIYEQLKGVLPEIFIIPVGNGTLLLGTYYGLCELQKLGFINKMPKIVAVQSENCAPLYNAFKKGKKYIETVKTNTTLAEGIAIAQPKRAKRILEAINATDGKIITAPEDKIIKSRNILAQKGFYVEPTTAATFAAFLEYKKTSDFKITDKIIIPLCGVGLKAD